MTLSHIITLICVAAGAVLLSLAIIQTRRLSSLLEQGLRGRWQLAKGLMYFFVAGYFGYIALLLSGHPASIELLNGAIFLGGAVFVLLVMSLSRATLAQVRSQQQELVRSQSLWKDTFDSIGDAITIHDMDFNVLRTNRSAQELLGLDPEAWGARKCYQVYHDSDQPPEKCPGCAATTVGKSVEAEVYEPTIGKHLLVKAFPMSVVDGVRRGVVHVVRDISEQKRVAEEQRRLEEQLVQVQKMEAVGRLAGGVAHDFNNLLSVVLSCSELALTESKLPGDVGDHLRNISEAGERAAGLTRQLLAFSRKQVLEVKPIRVGELTENLGKMLRVMIGEDVQLEMDLQPVEPVLADPGQIEQVLMNLAVNARDAMPTGGQLAIRTRQVCNDDPGLRGREEVLPGDYVLLTVSDSGEGIPPAVQERIFEPFFTTKEAGKGTGLGLATVYGIVKQHSGYIYVDSKPGQGTTFRVYLPVVTKDCQQREEQPQPQLQHGSETILVVDDEPAILTLTDRILCKLGYTVLTATSGRQALDVAFGSPPHLLLTDVVMADMDGRELADQLEERQPGIQTLFMSGYTDDVIVQHGMLEPGVQFLHKPLTPGSLSKKVRAVLDAGATQ